MTVSARRKLEASRINPATIHRELMGEDFDEEKFNVYLAEVLQADIAGIITNVSTGQTVEGASTINVQVDDYERALLRSDAIRHPIDIEVDGLWWRLASTQKAEDGDDLTLIFETREVAVLRSYDKKRVASRRHLTRAEFILSLIREVKEFRIPVVIPELHMVQDVKADPSLAGQFSLGAAATPGISPAETNGNLFAPGYSGPLSSGPLSGSTKPNLFNPDYTYTRVLTVKGQPIAKDQLANANTIIGVGKELGVRRKVLVCSIMTAIQESTLRNLTGGDRDSVGLFQQRDSWGTFEERHDPATAARLFFIPAHKNDVEDPTRPYWDLCQSVQISGFPTAYADWRTEAEKIVTSYGIPGGDATGSAAEANGSHPIDGAGSDYIYYRGKPSGTGKKWGKENSWDCIQRLADEVHWRAFFVGGTFYYLNENELYGQQPIAVVREYDEGVFGIGGDHDSRKKDANVTIHANIGRWLAPPGSVVQLADMGPWDGRWLTYSIERSNLFNNEAEITLHKPRPKMAEPFTNDTKVQAQTWNWSTMPAPTFAPSITGTAVPTPDVSGQRLAQAVLSSTAISFSNDSEKNDIRTGQIYEPLLRFLLWMGNNGYVSHISALKSDHDLLTSQGNISAHSAGKAVDIDTYNQSNPQTDFVMRAISEHQIELGFSQLIGPNPLLVIPLGYYDASTLGEHKSHIHIGWPLS